MSKAIQDKNAFREPISYISIFPDTDFNNIDEAYSLYGPGAYMLNLLHVALDPGKIAPADPQLTLLARRPDLTSLSLDEKNTDTVYPYLRGVVNIVLNYLAKDPAAAVNIWDNVPCQHTSWQAASQALNSFIPYNRPCVAIDVLLGAFGSSLNTLSTSFAKGPFPGLEWIYTQLGLSSADIAILMDPGATLVQWATVDDDITPARVCIYAGLDEDALLLLLYNGNDPDDDRTLGALFINADAPDKPLKYMPRDKKDTPAAFSNMSMERIGRIRIFLLLARATGWDYPSLNAVLATLGITNFDKDKTEANLAKMARLHFISGELGTLDLFPGNEAQLATRSNFQQRQDELIRLLGIANGLGVDPVLLKTYLAARSISAPDLETLFGLCILRKDLVAVERSLSDYMAAFIESTGSTQKFKDFDKWITQLQAGFGEITNTYSTTPDKLQGLLFKHWVHELAVYWGEEEDIISNLFLGFLSGPAGPDYTSVNNLFAQPDGGTDAIQHFLTAWLPYILLSSRLNISDDVVYIFGSKLPAASDKISPPPYTDDLLRSLVRLQRTYGRLLPQKTAAFVSVTGNKSFDLNSLISAIPGITSWPPTDIQLLLTAWGINLEPGALECLDLLCRLSDCFAMVDQTSLTAMTLFNTLLTVTMDNYEKNAAMAEELEDYLTELGGKDALLSQSLTTQMQTLLERDRNILVPIALWSLSNIYPDIDTPDQLSDYFLNDVSVSGILTIAPVREATDAVQTYLQRCKSGLENVADGSLGTIDDASWLWIESFRIWEAEQKLDQYPQNYFQPDNRSDASDLFGELKDRLQQRDLNDDVVTDAIQYYIDAWLQLTDKTVVDACYFQREKDACNILCFLAHSNGEKDQFYFLEAERTQNGIENFSQWKAIDTRIPADKACIVYAFNRYFIFWSELSQKTDSDPTSLSNKKYTLHTATVKYVVQDTKEQWLPARVWDSFPFYLETEDPDSKLCNWQPKTGSDLPLISTLLTPDMPWWQKPVAAVIGSSLYVWLSPVDPGQYVCNFCGERSDCADFPDFFDFAGRISVGYTNDYHAWLAPKKLDLNGMITDLSIPLDVNTQTSAFLFPWDNGTSKGILATNSFDFNDILKASLGSYYEFNDSVQGAIELINQISATGSTSSSNPWNVNSIQIIRGMQAAVYSTDIGTFVVAGNTAVPPQTFSLDTNGKVTVAEPASSATYFLAGLGNLFPQFYNNFFRLNGLSVALGTAIQAKPLDTNSAYDCSTYQTDASVTLPAITNATQVRFDGAYGVYARELFFYGPALIAQCLSTNLYFEGAARWQRYIFNPFARSSDPNQVWRYQPFTATAVNSDPSNGFMTKWMIEQYILNILDWGDNEFRQETWESLSRATQLYYEAGSLLGNAPEVLDQVSVYSRQKRTVADIPFEKMADYFGWPTDEVLKGYWDRVQDRLYKLGNGLNIDGQRQSPSEYGSPIDPGRLKLALQNGGINPYDESQLTTRPTAYRFGEILPVTESIIETTVQFGALLHNALQQKDAMQLQELQATHQVDMENFVIANFQAQIDEAQAEVDSLTASLEAAQQQEAHYNALLQAGLLSGEADSLTYNEATMGLQIGAAVLRQVAMVAHLIPTIYGLADGGSQPGSSIDSEANVLSETAASLQTRSQMLSTQAAFARRAEDWEFAGSQARLLGAQLASSLTAANTRLLIMQTNLLQHQLAATQAREVQAILTARFTNADLYNWMTCQLSSLYFKSYQLALGALHRLQTAYAYEVDDTMNFIPANSWNSLRKGLLAGETLKLAAARMKDAYLVKNTRRQEIERLLSLKQLNGDSWSNFISSGTLPFDLYVAQLTDNNDKRLLRIRSLRVSIPAVVGPYEVFNAQLTNNGSGETITISRGIDDMGIFPEDANDGRYLPFEGLTIPSAKDAGPDPDPGSWQLTVPDQNQRKRITDIILNIKFTAR